MTKLKPLTNEELDNVVGGSHISSDDIDGYVGHSLILSWGLWGCEGRVSVDIDSVTVENGHKYVYVYCNSRKIIGAGFDYVDGKWKVPYASYEATYFE